jgi:hypothetical protein
VYFVWGKPASGKPHVFHRVCAFHRSLTIESSIVVGNLIVGQQKQQVREKSGSKEQFSDASSTEDFHRCPQHQKLTNNRLSLGLSSPEYGFVFGWRETLNSECIRSKQLIC